MGDIEQGGRSDSTRSILLLMVLRNIFHVLKVGLWCAGQPGRGPRMLNGLVDANSIFCYELVCCVRCREEPAHDHLGVVAPGMGRCTWPM